MKTTDYNTDTLEARLLERFGDENHFNVPEGYFDSLTGKVMNRIAKKRRVGLVWRWAAAAVLVGCVAAGGLFFESRSESQVAAAEDIQYIEDALDYSMIDNMSIASFLTEAE